MGRRFGILVGVIRFVLIRILGMLPTLLGVFVLVACLVHLVPGDPISALLGDRASAADRAAMAALLGLDKPWWEQVGRSVGRVLQGDLGVSLVHGRAVAGLLLERLPATVEVAVASMLVAVAVGVPSGVVLSGVSDKGRRLGDNMLLALMAVPTFALGPLLVMVFAVGRGWFPVSGAEEPRALVLPALTLGLGLGAVLGRMTLVSMREQLGADYAAFARAKGASGLRVVWAHVLRNALLPVVVVFFLQLGMVLTGTVLTEAVFGWPGLGSLLVEALHQRDYPVIQACLLLISVVYMLSMVAADVVSMLLDPRVRA